MCNVICGFSRLFLGYLFLEVVCRQVVVFDMLISICRVLFLVWRSFVATYYFFSKGREDGRLFLLSGLFFLVWLGRWVVYSLFCD